MTWTRTLATGYGSLAWRVSIDGWPYEFVTHSSMAQTVGGRERILGLQAAELRFAENVDLPRAKWEAEGFSVTIADINKRATEAFHTAPTAVTYLNESGGSVSDSATTITVASTAAFASSGYIHLDTEAIAYTGKTSTSFTGCTRGAWSTLARYHYSPDGDRSRFPEVTDVPQIITGRRVRVYAYGSGDSKTGDGTQVWIGVASTEPRFNGVEWVFQVDALSSLLDQSIGADLEDPTTIRGIYYPATAPLVIRILELNGATYDAAPLANADTTFAIAGFWETQREFCEDLTAQIASQLSAAGGFTQTVVAEEDGAIWTLKFTTAATQHYMRFWVWSAIDGGVNAIVHNDSSDGRGVVTVTASTTFKAQMLDANGCGTVPRAVIGSASTGTIAARLNDANKINVNSATNPPWKVYLADGAGVTGNTTAISVEWESTGNAAEGMPGDPFVATVESVDTTDRAIVFFRPRPAGVTTQIARFATAASLPEIRMGRDYGVGSLADFLSTLAGDTAQYLNTGAVPDWRTADYDAGELASAASYSPLTAARRFTVFAEVSLRDLIEHECRLLGCYPCLTSAGKLTFKQLRFSAPSEVEAYSIAAATIVVGDTLLSYERSAEGLVNTFLLRTGYDPVEDDHAGTPIKVRDVAAYGLSPTARVIECAPKTLDPPGGVSPEDVIIAAQRLFAVFGGPYAYVSVDVPLVRFSTPLGSVVSVTWTKIPGRAGTLGVTDKLGIVVGRDFAPGEATGRLTILLTDQRVGGYAPAFKISAISGTSGTTGPFTVTTDTTYRPSGTTAADWWSAGDKIRVYRWNDTSAGAVTGTVTSATGTSVVFTADSNWTHTGSTWALGPQVSTAITASNQKRFVANAKSDLLLDWSDATDQPPFTFA